MAKLDLTTSSPLRGIAPTLAISAAAMCFATGLGLATSMLARRDAPGPPVDRCALPAGIEVAALDAADRSRVVQHAIACSDLEHGRISADEYRARLMPRAVIAPIAPVAPIAQIAAPGPVIWGEHVRGLSTEFGDDDWSAKRVLGPPDVFPLGGDDANAWASLGEDDRTEHLEIGFAEPRHLAGVQIFETYNPGAVTRVEVIAADGSRRTVYQGKATTMQRTTMMDDLAHQRDIEFACSDQPIAAVRVTLDSMAVPGWNEIDAVGGVTCD